jgi:hypothetical protein
MRIGHVMQNPGAVDVVHRSISEREPRCALGDRYQLRTGPVKRESLLRFPKGRRRDIHAKQSRGLRVFHEAHEVMPRTAAIVEQDLVVPAGDGHIL